MSVRVVVIGGYGVFGSRLVQLLLRDGCQVWAAGRRPGTGSRVTGLPLALDRSGDLTPLIAVAPDVVVDATGPFSRNRGDGYRLAACCIANGIDYLDLSDDAAFTIGIARLDAEARAAGRFAISGASSVPGLSSSVVAALGAGMDEIRCIETVILPGNRAPRGRAVVASILGQAGRPIALPHEGATRVVRSWSGARRYSIEPGLGRTGYLFEVPDLRLFPAHFGARSVVFRAGLELAPLNKGLAVYSFLRGKGWLPLDPKALVAPARWIAGLMARFGSDKGAMQVIVTGTARGVDLARQWTLIAEAGDGPFVPATMVRALIRRRAAISPGARACMAEAPLEEAEAAMSDLAVRFVAAPGFPDPLPLTTKS